MNKIAFIASALLVVTAGAASAHSVNGTQNHQGDRIEHGRETGKITWTEGLKLRAEQKRIAKLEAEFRSDGYMSKSEHRKLRHMQDKASKHIAHEAHDGWKRAWWLPRFGY